MNTKTKTIGRAATLLQQSRPARWLVTLLVLMMTAATAWAAQPVSYLDACTGEKGYIHLEGWAYDPDASSQSIEVFMYIYTDAECTNQYGYMTEFTAGVSRPDVNKAKGITGDHGFNIDIDVYPPGVYWVKLFAVDTNGDANSQIGNTTKVTVTGYGPPLGSLEACTGGEVLIHVEGWAYDPDASSQSIGVNVYVYTDEGCTSQYGDVHVLTANVPRQDVNSSKGITGDHGFSADIAIADVGDYWVKVFAIDTNGDGDSQIGSTTAVTVAYPSWVRAGDTWDKATKTLTVNTVGAMAYQAYQGQTEIEHVVIGSSVTFFGGYDFYQCSNLKTVTFAEGSQLEAIGTAVFDECSSLTTVTFAENMPLTSIGSYVFKGCTSLENIALPDHVGKIGRQAFENCTSLTTIHIPASLTTIEDYAFRGCTSLATFTVDDASTTFASDDGVLTNKDGTSLVCYPLGRTATSYTVPEGMTVIAPYTFQGCTSLETVILPKGLTIISERAFSGCTGLTSITIPPNVTYFGSSSFRGCTNLSTFIALPENPCSGPSTALGGINKSCQFYVRSASYKTHGMYSTYKNNMTVISVVNTATGATATASAEPFITYDGTEYYVTGSTFTISRVDVSEVPTGYEEPFLNYVVTNNSGEDISATVLSGETLTLPESDVTVRARFTPIVYNITYDLDGGTADPANPETYTIESNITLNDPERFGFYFVGWTGTGLTEPTRSVTIPSGSTGDRTYTATWAYTPYIDADGNERDCTVAKRLKDTGGSQEFDDKSVEEAWYYVDSHEVINGSLLFKAKNTHIILFDDAALNLFSENYNITGSSLHIYGQAQSTGQLTLRNHETGTCTGIIANNLTINGGKVYIYAYSGDGADEYSGLAILSMNNITVNGGYITAYTTNTSDKAIFALGNITLGWHLPTDEFFTWHYQFGGDLIVKPGQSFINAYKDILTGTITGIAASKINQHRLLPCYAVNFDANGGNFGGAESVLSATEFDSNGEAHVSAPTTDPTRDGYTFGGWKQGEADFDFTAAVTSNLTLKAYWTYGSSVTFAKEGYGTYYNSSEDVVLPAGMKAYIVKGSSGSGALTYEAIADGSLTDAATAVVPKATAVMLKTAAGNATQSKDITLASPTDTRDFSANYLHGSDEAVETSGGGDGAKYYKLTYGLDNTGSGGTDNSNVLGWYWGADGGAAFESGAHKAWLTLPPSASLARSFIGLPDFDEATGIHEITDPTPDPSPAWEGSGCAWYSLDGRRLSSMPKQHGVYIVNGRKVVIK